MYTILPAAFALSAMTGLVGCTVASRNNVTGQTNGDDRAISLTIQALQVPTVSNATRFACEHWPCASTLEIGHDSMVLDGRTVLQIQNGVVEKEDMGNYVIEPLLERYEEQKEAFRKFSSSDVRDAGMPVILAVDHQTPINTVRLVLYTIGQAGLGDAAINLLVNTASPPSPLRSRDGRVVDAETAPSPSSSEAQDIGCWREPRHHGPSLNDNAQQWASLLAISPSQIYLDGSILMENVATQGGPPPTAGQEYSSLSIQDGAVAVIPLSLPMISDAMATRTQEQSDCKEGLRIQHEVPTNLFESIELVGPRQGD